MNTIHRNRLYLYIYLLIFYSLYGHAYDFEKAGLYYNILSGNEVEVTYGEPHYMDVVTIPSSVEYQNITYKVVSIDDYSFAWCYSLTSISIPGSVSSIGESAFYECEKLCNVVLYDGIVSIGSSAFHSTAITEIDLPNTVESIGESAFSHCNIDQLLIPASVKIIGMYAFGGCYNLSSIVVDKGNKYYDSRSNCNAIIETATNKLIIGCMGTVIPNSVTDIEKWAFRNHGKLASIDIPNNVKHIGELAFAGCDNLTKITVQKDNTIFDSRDNCNAIINTKSNTLIVGCAGTEIPYSIASIGHYAFKGISTLTTIVIPNNITSIGSNAFSECSNLIRVISEIQEPYSISESVFDYISSDAILSVPYGTKNYYLSFPGWTANFKDIIETENTSYNLSITSSGNGSAIYNGTTVRAKTTSFTVNEGTSATITFTPDNGYRIASVKVGSTDVTSQLSNNKYTIGNISANTTVTVTFEAIPQTTYSLSITVSGNGSASYSGTTIRGKTTSFTVNEGTSATITFIPDTGYRIASVKVGSTNVTSQLSNNQYTISNITANTTVTVTFEAIPPTTYTLSITATGNGSVSYSGTTVRGRTTSFSVNEGNSVTITFTPDNGYRIASVKVGNTDVTSSVRNNQYTISSISANTTVSVTFEAIPVTTYSLSVTASGNGSVSYSGTSVRNRTTSFTLNEGTSATIAITPDTGYRIASVKVGNTDVTSSVRNNQYTISSISANTTVSVTFEAIPVTTYSLSITASGNGSVTYSGTSVRNRTTTFTLNEGTAVIITITPDTGYRIASVKVGNTDVTSSVRNNQYTISSISANTTVSVTFEAIPVTTYSLSITASGGGTASYSGTSVRGGTTSFTVNEGSSVTITFTPDTGYRIASVKVNNTDVTSSISNNRCTISSISRNTTVSVEFEAITYSLSITASGNGTASYNGTTIKGRTTSFTVEHGTSATITFTPDTGYRIASVKVGNTDVTTNVRNNQYTISSITANTTVAVTFEVIPPTVYSLTITASGNGTASYGGTRVRSKTTTFEVTEGSSVSVTFAPDNGYRVASVWVNNTHVTANVKNNQYTVSNVSGDITMNVAFEVIPATTYTLSVTATGNGSIAYGDNEIRNGSNTFTVNEGAYASFVLTADIGFRVGSLKVNNADYMSNVKDNQFTVNNITKNTTVSVVFEEREKALTLDGMNFTVLSYADKTINLAKGEYGKVLEVPSTLTYEKETWTVAGIDDNALKGNDDLAAVIWNPATLFTEQVSNPNLLLYVTAARYAPTTIKNVVVNDKATSITLTDAAIRNDFYCPREFTAEQIRYTHRYEMTTGIEESRGWETIALPFDVDRVEHSTKGTVVPFASWNTSSVTKPFWLYQYGSGGFTEATVIRANTPYIISMPNNEQYLAAYRLNGTVTFSASNATVKATDEAITANNGDMSFVPCFSVRQAQTNDYALNVNNELASNSSTVVEGSRFIRNSRVVHPFEAYFTTSAQNARPFIPVFEDVPTGIKEVEILYDRVHGNEWFTIDGQKLSGIPTKKGVYIHNRKAVVR